MLEAVLQYIILQTLDGRNVHINTKQIVSFAQQKGQGTVSGSANCILNLSDGKFLSVAESCESIQRRLNEK